MGDTKRYSLRIPKGLLRVVKEHAHRQQRSINSQIIYDLAKVYGYGEDYDIQADAEGDLVSAEGIRQA